MSKHAGIGDEDIYELDLEANSPSDVETVIENAVEAVAAVEGRHRQETASAATAAPAAPPTPAVVPDEENAALMRERWLRTLADFDNYRKRTDRDKESLRRYAAGEVVRDLLDAFDNLERAVASPGSIEELKQGLQMVLRQQTDALRRHGIRRVETVGQAFDPAHHEAVMREESAEVSSPTVSAEFQAGYMLHDRLLRPAMVRVAMPAIRVPASTPDDDPAAAG